MRAPCRLAILLLSVLAASAEAQLSDRLRVPAGYRVTVVAEVDNARQMTHGERGSLFVGSRSAGRVYRLQDLDGDGQYERVETLLRGLNMPSGVAYRNGSLYVAAVNRILRVDAAAERSDLPVRDAALVSDRLPDINHHGWKYLKFGPDGQLYFNLGAPCNVCESNDPRFASILRLNLANGGQQIVAQGVRNSVGFAWHPQTQQLWFSDNGRDHLGDDQPDDELNRLSVLGQHFGFPFLHAGDVPDPSFYRGQADTDYQPPELKLGAHVAPLGLTFYTGNRFPDTDSDSLFIAEHGSWNRSSKVGYRVVRVDTAQSPPQQAVFIDGWLEGQRAWGRPVDVLVDHDGSLLVSDDKAGLIYRVSYVGVEP